MSQCNQLLIESFSFNRSGPLHHVLLGLRANHPVVWVLKNSSGICVHKEQNCKTLSGDPGPSHAPFPGAQAMPLHFLPLHSLPSWKHRAGLEEVHIPKQQSVKGHWPSPRVSLSSQFLTSRKIKLLCASVSVTDFSPLEKPSISQGRMHDPLLTPSCVCCNGDLDSGYQGC